MVVDRRIVRGKLFSKCPVQRVNKAEQHDVYLVHRLANELVTMLMMCQFFFPPIDFLYVKG